MFSIGGVLTIDTASGFMAHYKYCKIGHILFEFDAIEVFLDTSLLRSTHIFLLHFAAS